MAEVEELIPEQPLELPEIDDSDKRSQFAQARAARYDAWKAHIEAMYPRWDQIEELLRNQPEEPEDLYWDGFVYRHIPVLSSKAGAWMSYVCSTPTEANPYLVGTLFGVDAVRATQIEKDFYLLMKLASWPRYFRRMLRGVGIYGKTFLRCYPANHPVYKRPAFLFDVISPRDIFLYPNDDTPITDKLNVGHSYTMTVAEIKAKQLAGEFYADEDPIADDETDKEESQGLLDESESIVIEDENRNVVVVECFDRCDLGEGEEWYRIKFIPKQKLLLQVLRYDLPRPWYFDAWIHEEEGKFIPETSRFNDVKDIDYATSEVWNRMSAGTQMSFNPTTFAVGWSLPKKYAKNKPGTVVPILNGGSVFNVDSRYNPGADPILIQDLDRRADTMMRLGAQSQGGDPTYDKTATGANIRQQGLKVAVNDDLSGIDVCMQELGWFMQVCYKEHFADFKGAWGEALAVDDQSLLEEVVIWELNGKSPANTPQAQADAAIGLAQALSVALNPQTVQMLQLAGINWQELVQGIVMNSTLDNKQQLLLPKQGEMNA